MFLTYLSATRIKSYAILNTVTVRLENIGCIPLNRKVCPNLASGRHRYDIVNVYVRLSKIGKIKFIETSALIWPLPLGRHVPPSAEPLLHLLMEKRALIWPLCLERHIISSAQSLVHLLYRTARPNLVYCLINTRGS